MYFLMKKSVVVIINPISGTRDKEAIKQTIVDGLDKDLYDIRIESTLRAGNGTEIALEAKAKGDDIVVAVGGDGTVNEIGKALAGSETAMAIIPCGSGNGLARHLHIPMNIASAVGVINGGHRETIDYGIIDNHPFFCTCGIGFDAQVTMAFTEKGSRGLLTYISTTVEQYFKYKCGSYQLTLDDNEETVRAFLITIGNASQYGNNAYIAPRATMKDGLLDIVVLKPFPLIDVPSLAYRLFHKKIEESRYVEHRLCKHLIIHRDAPGSAHFDGEPLKAGKDIDIRIVPQSLHVIVPTETKEI
jgi:diacylglycerol kinase (ATP)